MSILLESQLYFTAGRWTTTASSNSRGEDCVCFKYKGNKMKSSQDTTESRPSSQGPHAPQCRPGKWIMRSMKWYLSLRQQVYCTINTMWRKRYGADIVFAKASIRVQIENTTNSIVDASLCRQSLPSLVRFEETCSLGDSYEECHQQKVPILKTIFHYSDQNSTQYIRILLTTEHVGMGDPRKRKAAYNNLWARQHQWYCNGIENSTISLAQLVATGDHHCHSIILECSSSITSLQSLSSIGLDGNVTYGNLTNFYFWQIKDHPIKWLLQTFPL